MVLDVLVLVWLICWLWVLLATVSLCVVFVVWFVWLLDRCWFCSVIVSFVSDGWLAFAGGGCCAYFICVVVVGVFVWVTGLLLVVVG